jgi:hypothetical protein
VQLLQRQASCPTTATIKLCKRIIGYLKHTIDWSLSYSPSQEKTWNTLYSKWAQFDRSEFGLGPGELPNTMAFWDWDFAGDTKTCRSTTGVAIFYRSCLVSWKSSLQKLLTTSTTEAESVALYDWVRVSESSGWQSWFSNSLSHDSFAKTESVLNALEDGITDDTEIPLTLSDSQSWLAVWESPEWTKKSKHFNLRLRRLHELFKRLGFVNSHWNRADQFTKPLPADRYIQLMRVTDSELKAYRSWAAAHARARTVKIESVDSGNCEINKWDVELKVRDYAPWSASTPSRVCKSVFGLPVRTYRPRH